MHKFVLAAATCIWLFASTTVSAQLIKTHLLDYCPATDLPSVQPQIAPAIAALIPVVATQIVNVASAAISRAAEPRTRVFYAETANTQFYSVTEEGDMENALAGKCIVVFAESEDQSDSQVPQTFKPWIDRLTAQLKNRNSKVGMPVFYFESEIQRSGDTGFFLIPRYIYTRNYFLNRWFAANTRDYVISLSFSSVSDGKTFGNATFTVKNVERERPYGRCKDNVIDPHCPRSADWGFEESRVRIANFPKNDEITDEIAAKKRQIEPYKKVEKFLNPTKLRSRIVFDREDLDPKVVAARTKYCAAFQEAKAAGHILRNRVDPGCPAELAIHGAVVADATKDAVARSEEQWAVATGALICDHWDDWSKVNLEKKRDDRQPLDCRATGSERDKKKIRDAGYSVPSSGEIGTTEVSISVAETENAARWLQALAKGVDESKKDLSTILASELDRDAKAAKAKTKAEADQDSEDSARLSLLDVSLADQKLQESTSANASDRTVLEKSLLSAKLAANKAHRKAGLPSPYPELE